MNMMLNQDFVQERDAVDLEKTQGSNPQLARLMKAWESKQASKAKKAGAFGLMAVSLAACGSDDDDDAVEAPAETGQVFTLTIDADPTTAGIEFETLVGGDGDDTFNAVLALFNADGLFGQSLSPTLQGGDIIDGGEGTDTLNAVLNGNFGAITGDAPTITNVEIINFEMSQSPAVPGFSNVEAAVNFANVDGVEQVWLVNTDTNTIAFPVDPLELTIFNVQAPIAVGVRDSVFADYFVDYEDGAFEGVTEQTIVLDNADDVFVDIEFGADSDVDTINIVSSGENVDNIFEFSDVIGTLNISGEGGSLDLNNQFGDLVTLAAGEYAGDLTIDLSDSAVLESAVTGAGDDVVTIAAAHFSAVVGTLETVALGEGQNTLIITDSIGAGVFTDNGALNAAEINALKFDIAAISGVDTLDLDGGIFLGVDAKLDLAEVGGLSTLVFGNNVDLNGNLLTVNGLEGGNTVVFEGRVFAGDLSFDTLGELSFILEDNSTSVIDTFTADGVTDMTVTFEDGYDLTVNTLNADDLVNFTVNLGEEGSYTGPTNPNSVAPELTNVTVTGGDASSFDLNLTNLQELVSTIDLSEMGGETTIDLFDVGGTEVFGAMSIIIGSGDLDYNLTGNTENDAREVFSFTSEDFGDVAISGFSIENTGNDGDRLDLSAFGINESNINIEITGADSATITADDGEFAGKIELTNVSFVGNAAAFDEELVLSAIDFV